MMSARNWAAGTLGTVTGNALSMLGSAHNSTTTPATTAHRRLVWPATTLTWRLQERADRPALSRLARNALAP
jgi:hypothetical protein